MAKPKHPNTGPELPILRQVPHSKDTEVSVLGAILIEKHAIEAVADMLTPESFYVSRHQMVYTAVQKLHQANIPIDLQTVIETMRKDGTLDAAGGAYEIVKLTNSVTSSANIQAWATILLQYEIERSLANYGSRIHAAAYDPGIDALDKLDQAQKEINDLGNRLHRQESRKIDSGVIEVIREISARIEAPEGLVGASSGFEALDKLTHGWQNTDFIILAARPSVGKTALALNFAQNAALHPKNPRAVAFFSLEMSTGQLITRMISSESEVFLDKIIRGHLDQREQMLIHKAAEKLLKAPIWIDDTGALTIFELRAKVRRLVKKHSVGLVIIDYLQLMSGPTTKNTNREQEISQISRGLKALAKELNIPIIALSQLSRELEKRKEGNQMPKLSDLRESGAIEQDADMVMFLYRPEYHGIDSNEHGESIQGQSILKIAKHRNGSLDSVYLKANLHYQKFVSYDNWAFAPQQPAQGAWRSLADTKSTNDDDETLF